MHSFAILGAGSDALKTAGSLRRLCGQTIGREKIPLSRVVLQVDPLMARNAIWRAIALKRPARPCSPIHNKERTRVPAHEYTPLTSRTRVRYSSTFLVSCWKSHTGMLLLCYECSLMFRIFSGNKWHSESKVSSNLCCLARREIRFWQAILDNEESNLHEKHWCGERWRKDMQLQSRSKQSLIVERFCFLHEEQVNS